MNTVPFSPEVDRDTLQRTADLQLAGLDRPGFEVDRRVTHAIAVLVPMRGLIGIYGPSCIAAAQLAISEVNARGGIEGRKLEAVFLDCDADGIEHLVATVGGLVSDRMVSAVVSMSLSEVRERVNTAIAGRVPHVYTPPFDGSECSPDVFTIGGTPTEQFAPAVHQLTNASRARRWAMIGKNNVWPHPSSVMARKCIAESGGTIVFEKHVPDRIDDPVALVEAVARARPDVIFMSLVGQNAVEFNRVFGGMGLGRKIFRLSELVEENMLLASGTDNTDGLFTVASYFSTLETDLHLAFMERYRNMHGDMAPATNVMGQSVYEGVHFYASLVRHRRRGGPGPVMYQTARGGVFHSNWHKEDPIYLAQADGLRFQVVDELIR